MRRRGLTGRTRSTASRGIHGVPGQVIVRWDPCDGPGAMTHHGEVAWQYAVRLSAAPRPGTGRSTGGLVADVARRRGQPSAAHFPSWPPQPPLLGRPVRVYAGHCWRGRRVWRRLHEPGGRGVVPVAAVGSVSGLVPFTVRLLVGRLISGVELRDSLFSAASAAPTAGRGPPTGPRTLRRTPRRRRPASCVASRPLARSRRAGAAPVIRFRSCRSGRRRCAPARRLGSR
jgi:hypothetical protein